MLTMLPAGSIVIAARDDSRWHLVWSSVRTSYPSLQVQVNPPGWFTQSCTQPPFVKSPHSFTSQDKRRRERLTVGHYSTAKQSIGVCLQRNQASLNIYKATEQSSKLTEVLVWGDKMRPHPCSSSGPRPASSRSDSCTGRGPQPAQCMCGRSRHFSACKM